MEALGILANLNLPDIDFERVVTQLDLMPFIITRLKVRGWTEDYTNITVYLFELMECMSSCSIKN